VNSISISWQKTNNTDLSKLPDGYFYAFTRGRNLLYIGKATKQNVKDRAPQSIEEKLEGNTIGVVIWVGAINKSTYERITEQMVLDAENLLIYRNQPFYNDKGKKSYRGRTSFRVVSQNMPYLMQRISIS